MRHYLVLTDIESLGHVAIGRSLEVVFVLVGDKFPNAAHEPIEHGQHLGRSYVSGAAQEDRLPEGDAREEALEVTQRDLWLAHYDGGGVSISRVSFMSLSCPSLSFAAVQR